MATFSVPGQNLSYAIPDDGQVFIPTQIGVGYIPSIYVRQGKNLVQLSPDQVARQYLAANGIDLNQLASASGNSLGFGPSGTNTSAYNPTLRAMYDKAQSLGLQFQSNANNWGDPGFAGTGSYGTNTLANMGMNMIAQQLGMTSADLWKLPSYNMGDAQQAMSAMGGSISQSQDIGILKSTVNQNAAGETVTLVPSQTNPNAPVVSSDKTGTLNDPVADGRSPATVQPGALDPTKVGNVNPNAAFQNNVGTPNANGQPASTPAAATSTPAAGTPGAPAAPAAGANMTPPTTATLQEGSTGADVQKLQDWLVSQGYMTQAQVNTGYGTYGPQTKAAVAKWQTDHNVDTQGNPGDYGPITRTAISNTPMAAGSTTTAPGAGGGTGAQDTSAGGTTTPTGGTSQTSWTPDMQNGLDYLFTKDDQANMSAADKAQWAMIGEYLQKSATLGAASDASAQDAINTAYKAALNDPTIAAKYGDIQTADKANFAANLQSAQSGLSVTEASQKIQMENAGKDLAKSYASAGEAFSGFRNKAKQQLDTQNSGVITSTRQQAQDSLRQMAAPLEQYYGSQKFATLFGNPSLNYGGNTLTYSAIGGLTGTEGASKESDVLARTQAIAGGLMPPNQTTT